MERWLPVPGFPGYEASSEGRVRSTRRARVLSGTVYPTGYRYVHIVVAGQRRHVGIHTLVLTAFAGPRPDGLECRHLNGDQSDNRPSNLRWGTHTENNRDRVRHGTHHHAAKTHCHRGHAFSAENTYYRTDVPGRQCRACARERDALRRQRRRARSAA